MTLDVELIKRDADAGTPGPWGVPDQTYRRHLTVEITHDDLVQCPGSNGAMSYTDTICTLEWSNTPEWETNARRIARVPELEAAFIEHTAEIAALKEQVARYEVALRGVVGGKQWVHTMTGWVYVESAASHEARAKLEKTK